MQERKHPFERQIFVCTNDRKGEGPSCADHQGEAVFKELRRIAKERGLHPRIRVAQAKCLGQCKCGVNIMVYPDGAWFSDVRMEDVAALAERYLPAKKDQ
jgi:NADH-quinone oxidoreductase subunit F/NADP-reducing hydrogenase subunit HndC